MHSLPSVVDISSLQEAHCVSASECHAWFSSSGYSFTVTPCSSRSYGCVILYRPSLTFLSNSWHDDCGRFLQCEFSFRSQLFWIVCLYAPNRNPDRDLFFDELPLHVDPSIPTVLVGDFNAVLDRCLDRVGSVVGDTSRESTIAICRLFDNCCCIDIWRYLHPSGSIFTWSRWSGLLSSRIDLVGCPYVWVSSARSCDIIPCPFSDHCPVPFCVSVPDVIPPGPGLWKLNKSILDEIDYFALISSFWANSRCQKICFSPLSDWWEAGKSRIKGLTVSYCAGQSKQSSQARSLLARLADHLKRRVDEGHLSCLGPYHSVLEELAQLDVEKAKGAQVWSRIRWVKEGETSSSYFFRLERKRSADGNIVSSPHDLCCSFAAFYSSLFTASPTDPAARDSLLGSISSTLSLDQAERCEGFLTVEECHAALVGMAKGKSPGLDRLAMEFYVKFWSVVGSDLV